ncbi:maleylpyruvate isomerase family mycothiol-dependent enzyme [Streptomyces sp. NPDC048603]|uniref:maleylpyruvate isomerase family mycothiol-dependent enzyme n=1 Tax=Streptomyces sp. NPDC048603 TaxID=3365577 RepID=UPI00371458DE
MEITEYVKVLEREGGLLAETAEHVGTDAPVPTCPGWRVADLLRHTGAVHRWAAGFVEERRLDPVPPGEGPEITGAELVAWYREGHADLVRVLSEAPADVQCWTFLPTAPTPLGFWARRQAHETTVHRLDSESARGYQLHEFGPVEPEFAEDGVDELLTGFHARGRSRVRTEEPKLLRIRAADTGAVWSVHLSHEPPRTITGDLGTADCEVTAEAAWLYAALWNRTPLEGPAVTGDLALARLWNENSRI